MGRSSTRGAVACLATLVLSGAAPAVAEPAVTTSAVGLRASPTTTSAVLGQIPAGSAVQVTHCRDWCEVEWQGRKGFAIAASLNRRARAPAQRDAAEADPVPMGLPKVDEAPQRNQGPYVGGAGPGRGFGWLGYRGRW
jgi:uncharacterized protein YraI